MGYCDYANAWAVSRFRPHSSYVGRYIYLDDCWDFPILPHDCWAIRVLPSLATLVGEFCPCKHLYPLLGVASLTTHRLDKFPLFPQVRLFVADNAINFHRYSDVDVAFTAIRMTNAAARISLLALTETCVLRAHTSGNFYAIGLAVSLSFGNIQ